MRFLPRRFTRRCPSCKGTGRVACHLCDGAGTDCLLCTLGVAPCECPAGLPYMPVTLTATDGQLITITRGQLTDLLDQYGRDF